MSEDQAVVDFLNSSKQKVLDFTNKNGSDPVLKDLLNTSREISQCVDDVLKFLNPCFLPNAETSIKRYEDYICVNRDVNFENELSFLLQQIQNESCDFLSFLENLQLIYSSLYLVNNNTTNSNSTNVDSVLDSNKSNKVNKKDILKIYNDNLLLNNQIDKLKETIVKNENKLKELENTKLNPQNELKRYLDVLSNLKSTTTTTDSNNLNEKLMVYNKLSEYQFLNPTSLNKDGFY